MTYLPENEYVLVQTFPQSVTEAMVEDANQTGMILQTSLIGLFAVYIVLVLLISLLIKLMERSLKKSDRRN